MLIAAAIERLGRQGPLQEIESRRPTELQSRFKVVHLKVAEQDVAPTPNVWVVENWHEEFRNREQ